jgi:hypothetical protein
VTLGGQEDYEQANWQPNWKRHDEEVRLLLMTMIQGGQKIDCQSNTIDGRGWISGPSQTYIK